VEDGWIKKYRKTLNNPMYRNYKLSHFWDYCLLKATHKKCKVMVGYQVVDLEPGQFVFGRDKASEETGLSVRTVRTCVDNLSKMENLTIKATNKYSVITIMNWHRYQGENSQPTNKRPANDQQTTTYKNIKNTSSKEEVNIYGEFKNVKLSKTEYEKLVDKLTLQKTQELIENLSQYIASKGKKYKSHYATILQWSKMARKEQSYGVY